MTIFSYYNSKVNHLGDILGVKVGCFEKSVGLTCVYADVCKCTVKERDDGARYLVKAGSVRCFAAVQELLYPNVFNKRRINTVLARSGEFYELAKRELTQEKFQVFRPYSSGDMETLREFAVWRKLALDFPGVMFFGYTKNYLAFEWLMRDPIDNYKLCYSWGGKYDNQVNKNYPICYIKKDGLYCPDNVPVINLKSGEDYQYIIAGQSFAIPYH